MLGDILVLLGGYLYNTGVGVLFALYNLMLYCVCYIGAYSEIIFNEEWAGTLLNK